MSWYADLVGDHVIKPINGTIDSPYGFKSTSKTTTAPSKQDQEVLDSLKSKKAWEIATGPAKQIPVNLFMSYMSGNALQMIPISMTIMLFTNAINAMLGVNQAFNGLESAKIKEDIMLAKATYLFFQLVTIGIGVYKLNSMGLIPNRNGDWLSWEVATDVSSFQVSRVWISLLTLLPAVY